MLRLGDELYRDKVLSEIKIIADEAKNLYNLGEGITKEMKKSIPAKGKKLKKI